MANASHAVHLMEVFIETSFICLLNDNSMLTDPYRRMGIVEEVPFTVY